MMIAPKLHHLRIGLLAVALATPMTVAAQQAAVDNDDAALAYAQCMRDNGYAEFPDPMPGKGLRFLITPGGAPRFEKAAAACSDLAPEGMRGEAITPEALEALMKLAQCVRENGVANFPDPTSEGRFELGGIGHGPDDPAFKTAMDACRGTSPGARIMIGG